MELQKDYIDITEDYYYNMGYKDATSGIGFWRMISFTAGFLLALEFSKGIFQF